MDCDNLGIPGTLIRTKSKTDLVGPEIVPDRNWEGTICREFPIKELDYFRLGHTGLNCRIEPLVWLDWTQIQQVLEQKEYC